MWKMQNGGAQVMYELSKSKRSLLWVSSLNPFTTSSQSSCCPCKCIEGSYCWTFSSTVDICSFVIVDICLKVISFVIVVCERLQDLPKFFASVKFRDFIHEFILKT